MASDSCTVHLPADLCGEAQQKFGERFSSVDELLAIILRELVQADSSQMDHADRKMVEQRLRDLGYT